MSATVFSLPVTFILLIHLHLLRYPHANKPEYDHNIFNARVRSLRNRTRTMEDVCHFLIGRIEGAKDRVRKGYFDIPMCAACGQHGFPYLSGQIPAGAST
ncbi:hypothetical protein MSAN_00753600 [Mycena sanguinolenta]|uniref:Uncharacterized protein n=1 Tax=Mycena sanguinolenta TaxID=230812 RepID=A0A8H6Z7E6_9AGAR|nr:hypothetical protein MSAN_00753600 [Mycena sanguinolenta]